MPKRNGSRSRPRGGARAQGGAAAAAVPAVALEDGAAGFLVHTPPTPLHIGPPLHQSTLVGALDLEISLRDLSVHGTRVEVSATADSGAGAAGRAGGGGGGGGGGIWGAGGQAGMWAAAQGLGPRSLGGHGPPPPLQPASRFVQWLGGIMGDLERGHRWTHKANLSRAELNVLKALPGDLCSGLLQLVIPSF